MKARTVILTPEARNDLLRLYDWIANAAGADTALAYVDRIETYCLGFEFASERGHLREDVRPGLRIVGFERRVSIAFVADDDTVTILRLFYGGQDWEAALA